MPSVFGEPDARVDHDAIEVHPRCDERVDSTGQFIAHRRDDVAGIVGVVLHHSAVRAPMHRHIWHAQLGDRAGHRRVRQAPADVVDDLHAQRHGGDCHFGAHGVDANRNTRSHQFAGHRYHSAQLFGCGDPLCSWPSRFTPDVDDVGSSPNHRMSVCHCRIQVLIPAAVGERVWCDVEDTHHQTALRLLDTTVGGREHLVEGLTRRPHAGAVNARGGCLDVMTHALSHLFSARRAQQRCREQARPGTTNR